jgi:hypothetical protein
MTDMVERVARAIKDKLDWVDVSGHDYRDAAQAAITALSSTNGDDGELTERLTAYDRAQPSAIASARGTRTIYPLINPDGPKAANRIASLNAELAKRDVDAMYTARLLAEKSAQLERMREALEAIVEANRKARDMVPDEEEGLAAQIFAYHINEADRQARAALNPIGEGGLHD